MTDPVFVDNNVFLYARDAGEPAKRPRAVSWLEHLWAEQLGRTSMQVLSEYHVNATRKLDPDLSPDEAWDDVEMLLTWWDSLIVAAARLQGCSLLLSEDLQDGAVIAGVVKTSQRRFTASISSL